VRGGKLREGRKRRERGGKGRTTFKIKYDYGLVPAAMYTQ